MQTAMATTVPTHQSALEREQPGMGMILRHLAASGFVPNCILDIGAYHGEWATLAAGVWPNVPVMLVEGNPEKLGSLLRARNQIRYCTVVNKLLGAAPSQGVPFFLCEGGSSTYRELTGFEKREIVQIVSTLDTETQRIAKAYSADGPEDWPFNAPCLLKLDVQGAELDVLRGGMHTLTKCEVVIMELSTLEYSQGAPLFAEAVAYMHDAGFCAYDFCGAWRRQTDGTLFQIDVVFVRRESKLRAYKKFWVNEPEMQRGNA